MLFHQQLTFPLATIIAFVIVTFNTSESLPLRAKRAFSYIANETACTVDHIVYHEGDPIPTDDPCETCRCRPPGFSCVLRECEIKTGCRAIRRIGECCPLYQCGCEHNGKYYHDGERIQNAESPCYSCYCQGSSITCSLADCKFRFDCEPEYIIGECCPRYDHCLPELSVGDYVTVKSVELTSLSTASVLGNQSMSSFLPAITSTTTLSSLVNVGRPVTATTAATPVTVSTHQGVNLSNHPTISDTSNRTNINGEINIESMFTELPILLFTNETIDRNLPEAIKPTTESATTTKLNLSTDSENVTAISLAINSLDLDYTTTSQSVMSTNRKNTDLTTTMSLAETIDNSINSTESIETSTLAPLLDYRTTDSPQQVANTQTEYSLQISSTTTPEIKSESSTISSYISLSNMSYFSTDSSDLNVNLETTTQSIIFTKSIRDNVESIPVLFDSVANDSQLFTFSPKEFSTGRKDGLSDHLTTMSDVSIDEILLSTQTTPLIASTVGSTIPSINSTEDGSAIDNERLTVYNSENEDKFTTNRNQPISESTVTTNPTVVSDDSVSSKLNSGLLSQIDDNGSEANSSTEFSIVDSSTPLGTLQSTIIDQSFTTESTNFVLFDNSTFSLITNNSTSDILFI